MIITGGAGFIGSHVVRRLNAAERSSTIVIDDLSTGSRDNVPTDVELITGCASLCWSGSTHDEIMHFASRASPDDFLRRSSDIVRANVGGMLNMETQIRAGGLLIVASSSEVYGQPMIGSPDAMKEGSQVLLDPLTVRGTYDASKLMLEAMAYNAAKRLGIRCLILRIFNTYGPGMPDDGRVINTFVRQVKSGEPMTIHGDGTQWRTFCYIDDAVDQIMALRDWARGNLAPGEVEVFNVGGVYELSVAEVAHVVGEAYGGEHLVDFVEARSADPQWRRPNLTKVSGIMGSGWLPKYSIIEGIKRCF